MSQLRVYRVLRPFYMIQNSSIMKKMLNAVRRSLPEVLGVLVVLTLNVVIFGLSGHILFSDTIRVSFCQPLIVKLVSVFHVKLKNSDVDF